MGKYPAISTGNQNPGFAGLAKDLFEHFKCKELGACDEVPSPDAKPGAARSRIVVMVGAGGSAQAGLPLGQELKEILIKELTQPDRGLLTEEGLVEECCQYRARVERMAIPDGTAERRIVILDPSFDLLRFCDALSPYVGVRTFIRKSIVERLTTPMTCPLLCYELIAHLLNHGYIDHVTSLNFDTLLDQSIQDELGYDGCDIIVSDRDIAKCKRDDGAARSDNRARYLKPHGSIGSPESVRFTLQDTGGVYGAMYDMIVGTLFGDDWQRAQPRKETLTLVIIGWAGRDLAFRQILKENKDRIGKVYWLYPSEDKKSMLCGSVTPVTEDIGREKVRSLCFQLPHNGGNGLDGALLETFNCLVKLAKDEGISLPPLARHILYCYCFPPPHPSRLPAPRDSVRGPAVRRDDDVGLAHDRLQFEIFYFSLKSKGVFSSYNMAQVRRIQDALRQYRLLAAGAPAAAAGLQIRWSWNEDLVMTCFGNQLIHENLEEYQYHPPGPAGEVSTSMKRLLDYFWLKRSLYRSSASAPQRLDAPDYLSFSEGAGSSPSRSLEAPMKDYLFRGASQAEKLLAGHLARHLETVRCMNETEIGKGPQTRTWWLFREPNEIHSIGELKRRTIDFLVQPDWNKLRVIAETGEWLLEAPALRALQTRSNQMRNLKIELIAREEDVPLASRADDVNFITKRFARDFGSRLQLAIVTLPWWKHNTHLTLFLNHGKPLRGLYFRRYLNTPIIYPVALGSPDDAFRLNRIFEEYFGRAEKWKSDKAQRKGRGRPATAGR